MVSDKYYYIPYGFAHKVLKRGDFIVNYYFVVRLYGQASDFVVNRDFVGKARADI